MTDATNRPAIAGLTVALSCTLALGIYIGHGTASDTAESVPDYVNGSATVPDPVPDGDTVTRDPAPIVGDVTAPWQAGWTVPGDDDGGTIPACEREDGPDPCYWDADTRGNGEGRSFVTDRDGRVTYLGD